MLTYYLINFAEIHHLLVDSPKIRFALEIIIFRSLWHDVYTVL